MKKILALGLGILVLLPIAFYFLFPERVFQAAVSAERYAAGLASKNIPVDQHRIAYLEGGKGETVILLHGFSANKDNWVRFAKDLTGSYHVIIPDLPGFGESSKLPTESYDIAAQVERLDRFAGAVKANQFHLAGNSMGGMIAAAYGARYPAKVKTLALLAPGGLNPPQKSEFIKMLEKGVNSLSINNPADFDRVMAMSFVNPPYMPASFKKVLALQAVSQRAFNDKIMGDITSANITLEPLLPAIQSPVLIVWGDQDKILDKSGAPLLEKGLKKSTTVVMGNTGHIPMLEKPGETAAIYLKFLKNP